MRARSWTGPRLVLGCVLLLSGVLLAGLPTAAEPLADAEASWQPRWTPEANVDGLAAFEGVEDDRANSHPAGQPHIFVEGNNYRFNMHMVDRDTSTDRQRQEVKGMVPLAAGANTVQATATTVNGGPNVDYLEV
jgi:hypothetical protein